MVIEYARHEAGLDGASSSEFDPDTEYPVIATMAEQVEIIAGGDLGGTMRLGLYPAKLEAGSIVAELYEADEASERHRHRYEVNNNYRDRIAEAGLVFSGTSPDGHLVEYVELPRDVHPFYVGTQAHPELRSRPNSAHPLFRGLIAAALDRQESTRLFEVKEDARPHGSAHRRGARRGPRRRARGRAVHGTRDRLRGGVSRSGVGRASRHRRPRRFHRGAGVHRPHGRRRRARARR